MRDYKSFAAGEFYHVFNRGNGKMDIFRESSDYELFLSRLEEYLYPERRPTEGALLQGRERYQRAPFPSETFSLIAYCLMPNHHHLLIRQNTDTPIGSLMLKLCGGYARCFNKKYDRVGSLYQDQFKAVRVDSNEYLLYLTAYIHLNPVTAALVRDADQYPYSSYKEHLGEEGKKLCVKDDVTGQFGKISEYEAFVQEARDIIRTRDDLSHYLIDTDQ